MQFAPSITGSVLFVDIVGSGHSSVFTQPLRAVESCTTESNGSFVTGVDGCKTRHLDQNGNLFDRDLRIWPIFTSCISRAVFELLQMYNPWASHRAEPASKRTQRQWLGKFYYPGAYLVPSPQSLSISQTWMNLFSQHPWEWGKNYSRPQFSKALKHMLNFKVPGWTGALVFLYESFPPPLTCL